MTVESPSTINITQGARPYYGFWLLIYDYFVLYFMSNLFWRCSTSKITLPFFRQNVRKKHLDIGVGTGYFTAHGNLPPESELTLSDLNTECLDFAKARLRDRPDVRCRLLYHNVLDPFPFPAGAPYDSISMFYLLHCLPGPCSRKTAIFAHLKQILAPLDGVLFGTSILGERRFHTKWSYWAVRRTNRKKIMDNMSDNEEEMTNALKEHFQDVKTKVVGCVFLFKARKPIL